MKAMFGEEYYRKYWDRFLQPVPGGHYRNLESELAKQMKVYEGIGLGDEAIETIRKIEAQKIADSCKSLVLKEMKTIKDIEAGVASLGHTTKRQEIEARGELRKRFEFNCLQLADFRKKYL